MSGTAARDLVRAMVLKTNPYWPFTRCNRWPYAGALYMFVRPLRTRPEIRSIYLRRVPPERAWTPGLSDIDLTLVLEGGMSAEREYDMLASFWRTYARLKRLFPMLGEVEILGEDEVSAWLTWTIADPDGPSWTLLHGQPDQHVLSAHSPHWRRRALITALWIYVTLLPPCLARPDSSLRRHDILRRVTKVLRLLEPMLAEAGHPHLAMATHSVDPADLVAGALKALEAGVAHVTPTGPRHGPRAERRDSVFATRAGHAMLVIDDGLDRDAIARRLRSLWRDRTGPRGAPLVLPHCVLAYLVRHFDPNDYGNLMQEGEVVEGPHPLADIAPPGREEFAAHAMDRIFHLPLFVRGAELFSHPLSVTSLRNQLNSALAAILFLRNGRVMPYESKPAERWRVELPQYVTPFEQIQILLREQRLEAAHQAAFGLLRSILRDARDLMALDLPQQGVANLSA